MVDLQAVVTELVEGEGGWSATVELRVPGRVVELSVSGDYSELVAQVLAWYPDRSQWDPRNHRQVLYTGRAPERSRAEFRRV